MNHFNTNPDFNSAYTAGVRYLNNQVKANVMQIVGAMWDSGARQSKYQLKQIAQAMLADYAMPFELAKLEATLGGYDVTLPVGSYNVDMSTKLKHLDLVIEAIKEKYSFKQ